MAKVSYEVLRKKYDDLKKRNDVLIREVYSLKHSLQANIQYIKKLEKENIEYKLLLDKELKWRLENEKVSDKRKET